MEATTKIISLNTIDISYSDAGYGNTPLIFIHGFPFDKTMWQKQVDFLQASTRVITYDIRGFGASTKDDSPFSIDLFTYDLINFMDTLEIEKAIICGLSMGGYICLNAIKQFPERFEGVILCDTQCMADTAEAKEKRFKTIDQIEQQGTAEFAETFVKSIFFSDSFTTKKDVVENIRKTIVSTSPESIISALTALAQRAETCTSLDAIDVPVLILCGQEDKLTPLAKSEYMYDHIKGSTIKVIEAAGHVSNIEQPDIFNNHIFDFLFLLHTRSDLNESNSNAVR